ncbi:MAG: 7-cyano-7-deazaguanine synthase [Acidimicrobiales bacterium]
MPTEPSAPPSSAPLAETSCLVLFSGGLDSTVALTMAVQKFDRVIAVMFDYGQRSKIELERAEEIADWFGVELRRVEIDLASWGGSLLFDENDETIIRRGPYVPARNLILLSLAAGLAEAQDLDCVWLGTNASEQGFADTSPAFVRAVQQSFDEGLRRSHAGRKLRIGTPLVAIEKQMVVKAGMHLGAPLHRAGRATARVPSPARRASHVSSGVRPSKLPVSPTRRLRRKRLDQLGPRSRPNGCT